MKDETRENLRELLDPYDICFCHGPDDYKTMLEKIAAFVESAVQSARNEALLEEAEYWFNKIVDPWAFSDSEVGGKAASRITERRVLSGSSAVRALKTDGTQLT